MAQSLRSGKRLSAAARYSIGLGLPFLSVIPTVPLLGRLPITWYGLPLAVWWLFACVPLCSLCLAIVWFLHDRHQPDEAMEADYESGEAS